MEDQGCGLKYRPRERLFCSEFFARITKSECQRRYVRPFVMNNSASRERIFMEFDTWIFVAVINQQDATMYSLFISANCSTYFGWYLHPSSGAHVTVSIVSVINQTFTAACRVRDWTRKSNGLINATYCRYSDMSS